jgi:glycerol-3-phosphate acyltransferase PlsY
LPAAGFALLTPAAGLAAGAGAVLGHVTSPLLRGRGGKGVATAAGAVLGSHPLWAPAAVLVWLAVLGLRRSVALASVASVVTLPVQAAVWWAGWPSAAWASGIAAVVIVRHQSNLRRWLAEKATARTACGDANGCPQEEL